MSRANSRRGTACHRCTGTVHTQRDFTYKGKHDYLLRDVQRVSLCGCLSVCIKVTTCTAHCITSVGAASDLRCRLLLQHLVEDCRSPDVRFFWNAKYSHATRTRSDTSSWSSWCVSARSATISFGLMHILTSLLLFLTAHAPSQFSFACFVQLQLKSLNIVCTGIGLDENFIL